MTTTNKPRKYDFTIKDLMDYAESIKPEGWKAYIWQHAENGSIVTGSIPVGTYRSGPRKGHPKFLGDGELVVVTTEQMQVVAQQYETKTGHCWECKGSGEVMTGWTKEKGKILSSCRVCKGTGKKNVTV